MNNVYTNQAVVEKQEVFFAKCRKLADKLGLLLNVNDAVANDNLTNATFSGFLNEDDSKLFFGIAIYPSTDKDSTNFSILFNSEKEEDNDNFGRVKQPSGRKIEEHVSYGMRKLNQVMKPENFRSDFKVDFDLLGLFIKEIKEIKMD